MVPPPCAGLVHANQRKALGPFVMDATCLDSDIASRDDLLPTVFPTFCVFFFLLFEFLGSLTCFGISLSIQLIFLV